MMMLESNQSITKNLETQNAYISIQVYEIIYLLQIPDKLKYSYT